MFFPDFQAIEICVFFLFFFLMRIISLIPFQTFIRCYFFALFSYVCKKIFVNFVFLVQRFFPFWSFALSTLLCILAFCLIDVRIPFVIHDLGCVFISFLVTCVNGAYLSSNELVILRTFSSDWFTSLLLLARVEVSNLCFEVYPCFFFIFYDCFALILLDWER